MKHLIVANLPPPGGTISLSGDDLHYLVAVRRVRTGDTVVCADGRGAVAAANVQSVTRKELTLKVRESALPDDRIGVTGDTPRYEVCLPLLKGGQFDRALRQVTELGAHRVVPTFTRNCVRRPHGNDNAGKRSRQEKILREACQQSGRPDVPELTDIRDVSRLAAPALRSPSEIDLVFHERASSIISPEDLGPVFPPRELPETPVTVRILTGPEGGLAEDEIENLAAAGWLVRALPVPVLRAETAVVAAFSIVLHIVSRYTCVSR